eukprot:GFYU01067704.1.p1 GENE.GFYU01067704.1~~GFYU01067704.1.p1  ORF type:complete len:186 (+),score=49.91 GFYU01067704.1:114-671(+)
MICMTITYKGLPLEGHFLQNDIVIPEDPSTAKWDNGVYQEGKVFGSRGSEISPGQELAEVGPRFSIGTCSTGMGVTWMKNWDFLPDLMKSGTVDVYPVKGYSLKDAAKCLWSVLKFLFVKVRNRFKKKRDPAMEEPKYSFGLVPNDVCSEILSVAASNSDEMSSPLREQLPPIDDDGLVTCSTAT